ncbi:MAG: acyltransferase family protein, partial [Cyanobium sp.]
LDMAEISRHPPAESASNYRAEIDGLRAVAVIAVIINHFDHAILPGGFLGVDIFFVISGYVITASLWRNRSTNLKSFLSGFYQRRLKRLLPALLLVIVVSSLLIRLLSPDPGVYLGVGWRAIFGISNIQLYKMSSDYFSQDIALNPFTHTWSLGVEEQFYLVFPWLVWASGFGRRPAGSKSLLAILTLMAIPSLLIFLWLYPDQHAAAYFLRPPRFWELAAGSLLFAWQVDRRAVSSPQPLGHAAAAVRPAPGHRFLPLAVLLLMLATMLVPHQQGGWTIPAIVFLTVLLVAWLRPGDWGHRLLSQKPMVKLGLMSYSLYLWHWPVLCFSRWTIGIQPWSVPFQLGLILVLAKLCYQYVESPLRRANWGQQNRRIFQLSLLMAAAAATVLAGLARLPRGSLYLGDLQREDRENTFMRVQGTAISDKTCNWFRGEGPDPRQAKIDCTLIGQRWRGGPRVFVRGDSHTGHLVAWLADRQRRDHHWLQLLYVSSIPAPLIPIQWPADEAAWRHQDERVQTTLIEESLNQLRPGDVLILANHLQLRLGRTLSREQGVGRVELERRWQV